jgi:pimeloyl-ACP methyl ester carboxylesterase
MGRLSVRTLLVVFLVSALVVPTAIGPASGETRANKHRHKYRIAPGTDVPSTPNEFDVVAYDQHWYGGTTPSDPRAVLILVPGFFGGSQSFAYVGQRAVERDHSIQVWAMERRNNLLENRCSMEGAAAGGRISGVMGAALYYLSGSQVGSCPVESDDPDPATWNGIENEYFLSQEEAGSLGMADWGLETELRDVRALIKLARKSYPEAKVVLGGHSLGGMTAQVYAAWRFGKGKRSAGWRDIDGMVLIDGSVDGTEWSTTMIGQHLDREAELAAGVNYWEELSAGYTLGYLAEIGAMAASFDPTSESFIWTSLEGTPLAWPDPETCPTNKAIFAALTDDRYGFSATFEMHQGDILRDFDLHEDGLNDKCGGSNSDRDLVHWVDFDQTQPPEISPTDRWAELNWISSDTNFAEWFFSIALNSELDLAHNLDSRAPYMDGEGMQTTAAESKGQRVFDARRVAVDVLGFVTANCMDRYEWYGNVSPNLKSYTVVDRSGENCAEPASEPWAHLDPILGADEGGFTNDFLVALSRWLRRKVI